MMRQSKRGKDRKKKKLRKTLLILAAVLFAIYWIACYFIVEAALVPSFMERLDAFEEFTEKGYSVQVYTEDIVENSAKETNETKNWFAETESERLCVMTEDGYELVARLFPNEEGNHHWALLLHGYTGWKEELYPIARHYAEAGYQVLVPDMRCSGESDGDFIGMGWTDRLDNMLWLAEILSRDPEAEIVIHGQSMGASCAVMMSAEESLPENVKAIIADSGYTDAYSMFQKQFRDWVGIPSFPMLNGSNLVLELRAGWNLKDASALEAIKKTELPVLLIHGTEDAFVPCEMSEELHEADPDSSLLLFEGAGHVQAADKDPGRYYGAVFEFLLENGF